MFCGRYADNLVGGEILLLADLGQAFAGHCEIPATLVARRVHHDVDRVAIGDEFGHGAGGGQVVVRMRAEHHHRLAAPFIDVVWVRLLGQDGANQEQKAGGPYRYLKNVHISPQSYSSPMTPWRNRGFRWVKQTNLVFCENAVTEYRYAYAHHHSSICFRPLRSGVVPDPGGSSDPLVQPGESRRARGLGGQVNAGRKGRPSIPVKAGEQIVLAEVKGSSGTVRRIWMTINQRDPQMLRALRLEFYWDNESRPAVNVPLGDFFVSALAAWRRSSSVFFCQPRGPQLQLLHPDAIPEGREDRPVNDSGTQPWIALLRRGRTP